VVCAIGGQHGASAAVWSTRVNEVACFDIRLG
jgi:hypothetical protein